MARSKLKKKKKTITHDLPMLDDNAVPIPNLPEKFLWMKVKSCTKIRKVLQFSLNEFSNHKRVVWSSAGQGIGKAITCAEIFKRKYPELHQITKLRYIQSKKQSEGKDEKENRQVPQIHILLSKDALDVEEPGYQAPGSCSMFQDSGISGDKSNGHAESSRTKMSNITAEEFAAMGLRTGQKRPRRDNQEETPMKKNKQPGGKNKN